MGMDQKQDVVRLPSERLYLEELEALKKLDQDAKPAGWQLSPKAVLTFLTGGKVKGSTLRLSTLGTKGLLKWR